MHIYANNMEYWFISAAAWGNYLMTDRLAAIIDTSSHLQC